MPPAEGRCSAHDIMQFYPSYAIAYRIVAVPRSVSCQPTIHPEKEMKRLFARAAAVVAVLMIGNIASVAASKPKTDYTPQECAKLEHEYRALQQKEKNHTLKAADRARMQHIDDVTNVFCS
jgi:hypothetical protein